MDASAFHASMLISPSDSHLRYVPTPLTQQPLSVNSHQPPSSSSPLSPSLFFSMHSVSDRYSSSYTYSPNTISPQALERAESDQGHSKASPRKRKSWGQVLPEPKTNLPPRKRAKTEDEKEQRRIERVKRNRLAAHNSRERKRAEVDQLTTEKECLEAQLQSMKARMHEMQAQLLRYQKMYPQIAQQAPSMSPPMKDEMEFEGDSAYSSSSTSTIDPREASLSSPGASDMSSPQSMPSDALVPAVEAESTTLMPDLTQHSAAMLCDLQCQSGLGASTTPPGSTKPHRTSTPSSRLAQMAAFRILCPVTITNTFTTRTSKNFSTSAALSPATRTPWPSRHLFTANSRSFSQEWNPSLRSALLRSLARASLSSPTPALARLLATSLAWPREVTDAAFLGGAGHEDDFTQERLQRDRLERLYAQTHCSEGYQLEDQSKAASQVIHAFVTTTEYSETMGTMAKIGFGDWIRRNRIFPLGGVFAALPRLPILLYYVLRVFIASDCLVKMDVIHVTTFAPTLK